MKEQEPSRWEKVEEAKTKFDQGATTFDLQDTEFKDKNVFGLMSVRKWLRKLKQWRDR